MEMRMNLRSSVKDGAEALNYKLGTKEHILWLKKKRQFYSDMRTKTGGKLCLFFLIK